MPNLIIRKLDKKIYKQLSARAENHGISIEEEARRIIWLAVNKPVRIGEVFKKYFGVINGVDMDIAALRNALNPYEVNE